MIETRLSDAFVTLSELTIFSFQHLWEFFASERRITDPISSRFGSFQERIGKFNLSIMFICIEISRLNNGCHQRKLGRYLSSGSRESLEV